MYKQVLLIVAFILSFVAALHAEDWIKIKHERVYLRSGPGNFHTIEKVLTAGTEVKSIKSENHWTFVELRDKSTGWVVVRALDTNKQSNKPIPVDTKSPRQISRAALAASVRGIYQTFSIPETMIKDLLTQVSSGDVSEQDMSEFSEVFKSQSDPLVQDFTTQIFERNWCDLDLIAPLLAEKLMIEWGGPADEKTRKYAQSILYWLADHTPADQIHPQIFLSIDGEDATSFGGGQIVFGGELVRSFQDESELAAVLAHELSHSLLNHAEIERSKQKNRLKESEVYLELLSESTEPDPDWLAELELMGEEANRIAIRPRQLKHEMQADSMTLRILSRSGYDLAALSRVLKRKLDIFSNPLEHDLSVIWFGRKSDLRARLDNIAILTKTIARGKPTGIHLKDRFSRNIKKNENE